MPLACIVAPVVPPGLTKDVDTSTMRKGKHNGQLKQSPTLCTCGDSRHVVPPRSDSKGTDSVDQGHDQAAMDRL